MREPAGWKSAGRGMISSRSWLTRRAWRGLSRPVPIGPHMRERCAQPLSGWRRRSAIWIWICSAWLAR
eukprot:3724391-Lingulodinium_polyedra.AAC.1